MNRDTPARASDARRRKTNRRDGGPRRRDAPAGLQRLDAPLARKLVRCIVRAVRPEKVLLFGSRARGEGRADSDIDLLVIKKTRRPRPERAIPIYAALARLNLPVDAEVMVYTPAEAAQWSEVRQALVTTALREGKVLYEKKNPR
jgi:predicted nucleotidyltransferase